MITNELNTGLIEAIKEKIPANSNLANVLIDILFIGREAVYRRLRGEVPLTLTEAAIISRKLGDSRYQFQRQCSIRHECSTP